MTTGFFWDERCFWFGGGNYAFTMPVGGLVQPFASGGLPENPETKRRLKNLLDATGLMTELAPRAAPEASEEMLRRVHPASYLEAFQAASASGGGELGLRTPFGAGGYEQCALSAGLAVEALRAVMAGELRNAYALSRPPGHHCLPDFPNGFCLMANIAIALEEARAVSAGMRAVVLDWDVHHGNGTEAIYLERADTLAISIHQERNYPLDTGDFGVRGTGAGAGLNLNIPLPPGAGHATYMAVMEQIVIPQIRAFAPDVIVVACGYDAAAIDPLSRMMATADTFRQLAAQVTALAEEICEGRLVAVHEGGYSEVYVPFCGHAVIEEMASAQSRPKAQAADPFAETFAQRQPGPAFQAFLDGQVAALREALG